VKPYQDKNPENDIKPVVTEHYSEDSVEGINLMKKKRNGQRGIWSPHLGEDTQNRSGGIWWLRHVERKRNVKRR
jgi:hypothetical protein